MSIITILIFASVFLIVGYIFGIYIERQHGKDRSERQILEVIKWQKKTFPEASPSSKLKHLKQEVDELESDIFHGKETVPSEFADCFLLLFGAAYACGYNWSDIWQFMDWKMEINKNRKWGKPDKDGVVNHIKN